MIRLKCCGRILLPVLGLFCLVFAFGLSENEPAVAQSVYDDISVPRYLYYERSDYKVVMVNYELALDYTDSGRRELYNTAAAQMAQALYNMRNVWLEVGLNDDYRVIHYSAAINAGYSYADIIKNPDHFGPYFVNRPPLDLEMYIRSINTVAYRYPTPFEFPSWLKGKTVIPSVFSSAWVVDVYIDHIDLGSYGYSLNDIGEVIVLGRVAKRHWVGTDNRYRVLFYFDNYKDLEIGPGDIRLRMYDGTLLY